MADQQRPRGLFHSLSGLIATSIALVETRLEILTTELQEEKTRVIGLIVYALASVVLLSVGTVFVAVLFSALLWESNRLLALGICAAFFLGAGGLAALMALRQIRAQAPLFATTLAELKHDRATLERPE